MLKLNDPVAGLSLPSTDVMVELVLERLTLVPNDVLDPKDSEALLPVWTLIFTVSPLAAATGVGREGICCDHAGLAKRPAVRKVRERAMVFMRVAPVIS